MQEGFGEQKCDDGVLEIMGLKDGWHSAFVLLEVSTAVRLCQVSGPNYLKAPPLMFVLAFFFPRFFSFFLLFVFSPFLSIPVSRVK
jgi:hypothetical protein